MTVKELQELLASYPDEMPIAYCLHSEYSAMEAAHVSPQELFDNGGYLSSPYRGKDHPLAKTYLVFPGN